MAHHHQVFPGIWDLCWHWWHTWQGEIHCRRAGGVAADAHETITTETAKLLSWASEADDEDPFVDIELDEDELEENETVLGDC